MFPPSYKDRAILRGLKRQAIRQLDDHDSHPPDGGKAKSAQTDMTYCYHRCPVHTDAVEPQGVKKGKEKGKGKGEKGDDPQSKKDKGKGGKGKHVEFEESSSSSSEEEESGKKAKEKSKQGSKGEKSRGDKSEKGEKGEKGGKGDGSKKEDKSDPSNEFLTYPWSSPNFSRIAGFTRYPSALGNPKGQIGDKQDRREKSYSSDAVLEQMIESSRRTDEEYIARWLAERESHSQQGAVQWLEGRDTARFKRIQDLNDDMARMKLNLQTYTSHCPLGCQCQSYHRNNVPFPGQALHTPSQFPPYHSHDHRLPAQHGTGYHAAAGGGPFAGHSTSNPSAPLVAHYDENGNLCLQDGTKIAITQTQGFAPLVPFPGSNRPPLQPVGGNGPAAAPARTYQSQPAQQWQSAANQAPAAPGAAFPQQQQPQPQQPVFTSQPAMQQQGGNFNQPMRQQEAEPENRWAGRLFQDDGQSQDGFGNDNIDQGQWGGSNNGGQDQNQGWNGAGGNGGWAGNNANGNRNENGNWGRQNQVSLVRPTPDGRTG